MESIATDRGALPPPKSVVTVPPPPNDGVEAAVGQVPSDREVPVATALPREPGGDDPPPGVDRHRADAAGGPEVGLHLPAGAERGVEGAVDR